MKKVISVTLLSLSLFSGTVVSAGFGSHEYCDQLATIGKNAYNTKVAGNSMSQVLSNIGYILQDDPQKKNAAQGVVVAIYGDNSISSASEAYSIVYESSKQ
tara:strand:+ start:1188 stop:1490 length:303 start_codon:yes stop_codon:yes gene_type:complete